MAAAEEGESSGARWTREQDKSFENALAAYPEDSGDRWEKIAANVPGKSVEDVKRHYELLVEDVDDIESGRVAVPSYQSSSDSGGCGGQASEGGNGKRGGKSSKSDQERRKGIAWTEDEHRLFLLGLEKYGKGDWRSISRNFVISRTPTQVASHAQKYFIRLNSMNKDRRRTSIHDITTVASGDASAPQAPITGQTNASAAAAGKSAAKYPLQAAAAGAVGVGIFTATIGQPVVGGVALMPGIGYAVRPPVSDAPNQMPPSSSSS